MANFDIEYLEEGDIFDGSPIEQSAFISEVLNAGGSVKIDGNQVHIVSLPKKEIPAKALASPKAEVPKEAPKKVEAKVEPSLVDLASEEVVKETPKKVEAPKKEAPKAAPKAAPKVVPAPTDAKE